MAKRTTIGSYEDERESRVRRRQTGGDGLSIHRQPKGGMSMAGHDEIERADAAYAATRDGDEERLTRIRGQRQRDIDLPRKKR